MLKSLIATTVAYSRFNGKVLVYVKVAGSMQPRLAKFKGTLVTFISGAFSVISGMVGSLVFPKVESELILVSPLSVLPRIPEPYGTGSRPFLFARQTKLRVIAETTRPLANASEVEIRFRKPSGAKGAWKATIKDVGKGTIFYDVASSIKAEPKKYDFDETGTWSFWSWARFADGREIFGDPVAVVVYPEGSKEVRK